ncbi:MAG TPA: hypothetical protein VJJ72_02255 [Candidatus Paceibacterota bacterium]
MKKNKAKTSREEILKPAVEGGRKVESLEEILAQRKAIEEEIAEWLSEFDVDLTLNDIKVYIYNEDEESSFSHFISLFDFGQDYMGMSYALELMTDAWNYFPHKVLGGISPAEVILNHANRN